MDFMGRHVTYLVTRTLVQTLFGDLLYSRQKEQGSRVKARTWLKAQGSHKYRCSRFDARIAQGIFLRLEVAEYDWAPRVQSHAQATAGVWAPFAKAKAIAKTASTTGST